MGYRLNLKNPKTFNEKINWLKIYNKNPLYPSLVDKSTVKDYVAKKIGEEYVIPTYGVWDSFDEIDFDSLPDQFVLKSTNGGGGTGVVICRDKAKLDKIETKKVLLKSMQTDGKLGREWPYQYIKPRIIAEKLISDKSENGDLKDYKFMCFNGSVKCSFVCTRRGSGEGLRVTFFDRDWNKMPFERDHLSEDIPISKPQNYEEMVSLAEKLAEGNPFVRVDLYEVDGKSYFGELTYYPGCGFEKFQPKTWDAKLGELLQLDGINGGGV